MSEAVPEHDRLHDGVVEARAAYGRRDWARARTALAGARAACDLAAEDLFVLADAAWWLGDVETSVSAGEEAYRRFLHGEQPAMAAMAALTVAMNLMLRGDTSMAAGWMSRVARLVDDRPDTVEHWYLRYLTGVEGLLEGAGRLPAAEVDALLARAGEVRDAGLRLGDANLVVAGTVAEGRVRLKRGEGAGGLALLDEAMLRLLGDDLAPDWAGSAYCHLMAACHEVGDVARAAEWTAATERWLDTLPAAVLFRGICRVHRSQVLQARGAWDAARHEAERVGDELAALAPATAAEARYQVGELWRLRGELDRAAAAYRGAHELGRDPQPGMALLRLAEGRVADAAGAIGAAEVARRGDVLASFPVWEAQVRIAVAAGDGRVAEHACRRLRDAAELYGTSGFRCAATGARGLVELAAGRADQALSPLRDACAGWRALGDDHRAAEVCVWLAEAYRCLGAPDAADLESAAATAIFDRLGVAPAVRSTVLAPGRALPGGLTAREAEVLGLVAAGGSNRDVAATLVISEKTVARHLSNIFAKIGVTTRTEAAAYAFAHGLGAPRH